MKRFVCDVRDFIYSKVADISASGVTPGTRWEESPGDWVYLRCSATEEALRKQVLPEVRQAGEKSFGPDKAEQTRGKSSGPDKTESTREEEDLRELAPGEMSTLCSNLIRGCKRQYLKEGVFLFT